MLQRRYIICKQCDLKWDILYIFSIILHLKYLPLVQHDISMKNMGC